MRPALLFMSIHTLLELIGVSFNLNTGANPFTLPPPDEQMGEDAGLRLQVEDGRQ